MKILFVWRKIGNVAGGVERMITTMMNDMSARGHDVSLLTWDMEDAVSYYALDERIKWHKLDAGAPEQKASIALRIRRMFKVRAVVKKINPDVIMCFASGIFLSIRLFLTGFNVPMIAAERNAPSRFEYLAGKNKVFNILRMARNVTVQFARYKECYPKFLRHKISAISNPVKPSKNFAQPLGESDAPKIVLCVARLAFQKNIESLIQAYARLADDFPEWQLQIAGDGEDEAKVTAALKQSGKEHCISLIGRVKDVEALCLKSHLFCLPSRWEGFPNALAEAMAHGLPCIGYAGCSGTADLIQHDMTGLLADGNGDVNSLEQALRTLMSDGAMRVNMGRAAIEEVKKYSPEKILDQWEQHFLRVGAK